MDSSDLFSCILLFAPAALDRLHGDSDLISNDTIIYFGLFLTIKHYIALPVVYFKFPIETCTHTCQDWTRRTTKSSHFVFVTELLFCLNFYPQVSDRNVPRWFNPVIGFYQLM